MSEQGASAHDILAGSDVDSFSQLPFIRPAPPRTTPAIRLFGFDLPHEPNSTKEEEQEQTKEARGSAASVPGGDAGKKFECHYCCRNFPTSQALGGHQNAHKRERQHAKRAQFQPAMAVHHFPTVPAESHVYGSFNYHSLGSVPHHASRTSPSGRLYGDPLPGSWRMPGQGDARSILGPIHRGRPMASPLFGGDDPKAQVGAAGGGRSSSSNTSPQERGGYGSPGVNDHGVSLDLRL